MAERPAVSPADPVELAARVAEITERIEAAAGGRPVTMVAVTKTFPQSVIEAAVAAGLRDLGENYGQELVDKADRWEASGGGADRWEASGGGDDRWEASGGGAEVVRWHFIGGLQRNKIKLLGRRVSLWQTIDRVSLVDELAKRVPGARILIQVNTTGEAQKSGCAPGETEALVDRARGAGLAVAGLMTIGPTGGLDPRPGYEQLHRLAAECEVEELSMGMSADYELAIGAGATMVRLGSALFGPRSSTR